MKAPNEILNSMAFKIRQRRIILNISQEDIAGILGLTRISVVNIEQGQQSVSVENLLKLAKIFKCKPDELLPTKEEYDPILNEIIPTAVKNRNKRIEHLEKELSKLKAL